MEAPLLVAALVLMSSTLAASDFCVCRSDQPQTALQKTIDYACGAGADCNFIHEQGPCYNPNTVVAHCSWAANSYFQRKRGTGATCDFTGTATLTTTDPSTGTCKYPASASSAGTSTGNGTAPGAGAGVGTNPSSPGGATNPATPGMGGTFTTPIGGASGPSASIIGPESSDTPAATAASIGLRVLLGVASVLAFFVQ